MPNVMAALPNIGGALCSTPQSLADAQLDCRAVTLPRRETLWNLLGSISAASGPKFTILSEVGLRTCGGDEILLLNKFFFVDTCLSCEDIARQSCTMVRRWRLFGVFLRPAFPASRMQHVSDLHPKFARWRTVDNKYDTSSPKRQRTTPIPARRSSGAAFVPCGYLVFLFTDAVATTGGGCSLCRASRSK